MDNKPGVERKAIRRSEGWHSWEKKVQVVTSYIALGKAPMVEAVTGVPAGTIRQWKLKDWWKELEGMLREEGAMEMDAKLQKVVDKSLDIVMDRLEHGDFIYDPKSGNVKRRPVYLKDAARVAGETIDRKVVLSKFIAPFQEKASLEDQLKKLAEEFKKLVEQDKQKESKHGTDQVSVQVVQHSQEQAGLSSEGDSKPDGNEEGLLAGFEGGSSNGQNVPQDA